MPLTPGSTDPAVDVCFSHLSSAEHASAFLVLHLVHHVIQARAGFQFLTDLKITEVNSKEHRADNDSCLTCVSVSTERFC